VVGILVAFFVSWLLIWLVSREHITVLGIKPNLRRLEEFLFGLLFFSLQAIATPGMVTWYLPKKHSPLVS
jgi:hypothetical protein